MVTHNAIELQPNRHTHKLWRRKGKGPVWLCERDPQILQRRQGPWSSTPTGYRLEGARRGDILLHYVLGTGS